MARQLVDPGHRAWEIGWTVANEFRSEGLRYEDAETTRILVRYRQAIGKDGELWVDVPLIDRSGGFLDPIIDGWHKGVLGWSDPVRNSTPFGQCAITLGGAYHFAGATGIGDVSVGFAKALNPLTTVRAAIELPSGNASQLIGSGGLDFGVSVDHRFKLSRRWELQVQAAVVAQGKDPAVPHARSAALQGGLALIYRRNSRDSFILQWQHEDSPTVDGASQAGHRLLTAGYRRKLSAKDAIELSIMEDRDLWRKRLELANEGPDFTVSIRYLVRF